MSESVTGSDLDGSPVTRRNLGVRDARSLRKRNERLVNRQIRSSLFSIAKGSYRRDTCRDTFGATVLFNRLSILCMPVVIWSVAVAFDGMSSCCCCCCCSNLCFNCCCCCCCIILLRCCCNCSCCCCVNCAVVCLTTN